jgi:predicted RNA binding protein YcfA (HicA-like mRNA interferase family)
VASPVRFSKIRNQLEKAGFRLVRINGSHHIFDRPGGPLVSIPVHENKVKPFYAKQVATIVAADKAKGQGGKPKAAGEGGNPKGGEDDKDKGE